MNEVSSTKFTLFKYLDSKFKTLSKCLSTQRYNVCTSNIPIHHSFKKMKEQEITTRISTRLAPSKSPFLVIYIYQEDAQISFLSSLFKTGILYKMWNISRKVTIF